MKKYAISFFLVFIITFLLSAAAAEEGIKPGDTIVFGSYPQTAAGNDQTPVEWLVLETANDKALLLSRYGLDVVPYSADYYEKMSWEFSSLRSWLNNDFIQTAFTAQEQAAIIQTEIDNSKNQCFGDWSATSANSGSNTQDRIFLLSYREAHQYFGIKSKDVSNLKPRLAPTAYAAAKNANVSDSYDTENGAASVWWWLRSPGDAGGTAACIHDSGALISTDIRYKRACVRPVLWVDLKYLLSLQEQTEPAEEFSFRNNIAWGMSEDDVILLESDIGSRLEQNGITQLDYSGIQISSYSGNLTYWFVSDHLVCAEYILVEPNQDIFSNLRQAYTAKYGAEIEAGVQDYNGFISFNGFSNAVPDSQKSTFCCWKASGGTEILMVWYNETDPSITIVYLSPEFIEMIQAPADMDLTGV